MRSFGKCRKECAIYKDQMVGGALFSVCLVILILYVFGLFYLGNPLGWSIVTWLIALPVSAIVIAIIVIGAWIGWTMATTPPPKPIEEFVYEKNAQDETKIYRKPTSEGARFVEIPSGRVRCGNCGFANDRNAKYCNQCGEKL